MWTTTPVGFPFIRKPGAVIRLRFTSVVAHPMTIRAVRDGRNVRADWVWFTGKGLPTFIRRGVRISTDIFVMVTGFLVDLANVVAEFAGVGHPCRFLGSASTSAVPIGRSSFGCWLFEEPTARWRLFFFSPAFCDLSYVFSAVLAKPDC